MALNALTVTALALGIGAVLTGLTVQYRVAQIEKDLPPVGQFVDVAGGRVHYVQQGEGPDVILLHGAGGNLRDFTFHLMAELADRYTVTAFDRPGLGYTDQTPGAPKRAFASQGDSPDAQVAMLREAARSLGITDPIVVGHSFGGIIAMAWATTGLEMDDPTNASGVVLLAGVSMPWPGDLGAYYKVNGSALGGAIAVPLISAFVPLRAVENAVAETFTPQPAPAGYIGHLGGALAIRPDTFRANARQVNTLRPHVVEMTELYPDLTLPIEALHGTADTTVPLSVHAEQMVKIVQSANLIRLEGVGHQPHHVARQETVDAIDRVAARAGLR
ncbi:MAG: alpha/beta hydrolase [Yoonia sp.]|uniref:alpha/beta fold hydrolase n=1 Tax=Yoonia sp. TaxID=2212373 RepID=UPI00273D1DFC|nr:alpha/beta hydrolase [Yoonia sp.]MDP5086186.1 alpha/beta hydrolase [Yoonia sp.]